MKIRIDNLWPLTIRTIVVPTCSKGAVASSLPMYLTQRFSRHAESTKMCLSNFESEGRHRYDLRFNQAYRSQKYLSDLQFGAKAGVCVGLRLRDGIAGAQRLGCK